MMMPCLGIRTCTFPELQTAAPLQFVVFSGSQCSLKQTAKFQTTTARHGR
jgi:hypothetical protein